MISSWKTRRKSKVFGVPEVLCVAFKYFVLGPVHENSGVPVSAGFDWGDNGCQRFSVLFCLRGYNTCLSVRLLLNQVVVLFQREVIRSSMHFHDLRRDSCLGFISVSRCYIRKCFDNELAKVIQIDGSELLLHKLHAQRGRHFCSIECQKSDSPTAEKTSSLWTMKWNSMVTNFCYLIDSIKLSTEPKVISNQSPLPRK